MPTTRKDEIRTSDVENDVKPGEWNPAEKRENSIEWNRHLGATSPKNKKKNRLANQRRYSEEWALLGLMKIGRGEID
jgi:hypothetical protein